MSEDLDEKLTEAQKDHERMQCEFEIAKKKHESMQSEIDQLQHKCQELEIAIEEQKKKLAQYEKTHSDMDETVKANQQQQNKVSLAESDADSVIQGYLQSLLSDEDDKQTSGASTSTAQQSGEFEYLTEAIQQNRVMLMELLKRVKSIQKSPKNE